MAWHYRWLLYVVGAPVAVLLAALSAARLRTGLAAQIGTFALFIPVIVIVTVMWLVGWSFVIWLVAGLFSH